MMAPRHCIALSLTNPKSSHLGREPCVSRHVWFLGGLDARLVWDDVYAQRTNPWRAIGQDRPLRISPTNSSRVRVRSPGNSWTSLRAILGRDVDLGLSTGLPVGSTPSLSPFVLPSVCVASVLLFARVFGPRLRPWPSPGRPSVRGCPGLVLGHGRRRRSRHSHPAMVPMVRPPVTPSPVWLDSLPSRVTRLSFLVRTTDVSLSVLGFLGYDFPHRVVLYHHGDFATLPLTSPGATEEA